MRYKRASEALYLEQGITPTCFQKCQDIFLLLKLLIFFLSFQRDSTEI